MGQTAKQSDKEERLEKENVRKVYQVILMKEFMLRM
jgi:hypothetical protein